MSEEQSPLDKLNEAIKASWDKNNGLYPKDFIQWHIHEQAFLDGMQYALKRKEKNHE